MKRKAKQLRRRCFKGAGATRTDNIDKIARWVCLMIGAMLFPYGIVLIAEGNQTIGTAIILVIIPFMVLARWFRKIRIKAMGVEIEAE
jgi:hypothetical protein